MKHKVLLAMLLAGTTVPSWASIDIALNLPQITSTQQNGRKVTGKVLDENGEPIIGASIKVGTVVKRIKLYNELIANVI